MRDVAFARTIELRTLWIRAREASISLLDWRRQCHSGPPLRRIGPKDIDSPPVFPRSYSPGLPNTTTKIIRKAYGNCDKKLCFPKPERDMGSDDSELARKSYTADRKFSSYCKDLQRGE